MLNGRLPARVVVNSRVAEIQRQNVCERTYESLRNRGRVGRRFPLRKAADEGRQSVIGHDSQERLHRAVLGRETGQLKRSSEAIPHG